MDMNGIQFQPGSDRIRNFSASKPGSRSPGTEQTDGFAEVALFAGLLQQWSRPDEILPQIEIPVTNEPTEHGAISKGTGYSLNGVLKEDGLSNRLVVNSDELLDGYGNGDLLRPEHNVMKGQRPIDPDLTMPNEKWSLTPSPKVQSEMIQGSAMLFNDKFLGLKPFRLETTLNNMNDPATEMSHPSVHSRLDPQHLSEPKASTLEGQQDLDLPPLPPKAHINTTAQRGDVSEPQHNQSGKDFQLSERKSDHTQTHLDSPFSRTDVKVMHNTIPHVSEPVKPQSLPQIWLQQAQMVRSGETKTLKMTLHPESLGTLEVEIQLKNGLITGCIRVETEQAHGLIQKQLPEFMNAMDEHKIPAGAFEMQFRNEQGSHRESRQNQQRERNGFRYQPIEDQADAISKSAAVPSNLKRLDLLA
jgi:hypothetical protein